MPTVHASLTLATASFPSTTVPGNRVLFLLRKPDNAFVAQVTPTIPTPIPASMSHDFTGIAAGDFKLDASVIDANDNVVGSVKTTNFTLIPDANYAVAGTLTVS